MAGWKTVQILLIRNVVGVDEEETFLTGAPRVDLDDVHRALTE